ncbi:MAG: hypothetical protein H6Q52_2186 [Deltaproteobacteria bacterium]|nr:hypothetical protein [Deltaproteobacteria bacterium]
MKVAARSVEILQPGLEYGVIAGHCEKGFAVTSDRGPINANVAVSCLVEPQRGDTVLVSVDDTGCSYILSILERDEDSRRKTQLSFEGDVSVAVRDGSISIASDETIALASKNFELSAHEGRVCLEKTSFFGNLVESNIARIRIVADSLDSIVRRAVQRFKSTYRYVEEHEEVQSASTRMIVDGTLTMHTKNTMHIAEGHVKIDAEQIHLG